MKKGFFILLVLMFSSQSMAQSEVTIYGNLNVSLDFISSDDSSSLKGARMSSNSSRVGIKGGENLDNGLEVFYQFERGFNLENGGDVYGRDTWLGAKGNWGAVKAGNFLNPYDTLASRFGNSSTGTTSILFQGSLWGQAGLPKAAGGFDTFIPSSIRYDSPIMNGFYGVVQYASEGDSSQSLLGGGLFYSKENLEAAIVFDYNNGYRVNGRNDYAISFFTAYDFGYARPGFIYERIRYETGANTSLKRDFVGVSVSVPINRGIAYAHYGWASNGRGYGSVGNLHAGKDTNAQQLITTYAYLMSARTRVYAGYVYIDNDSYATYSFGVNGNSHVAPGINQQGIIFGMMHDF